MFYAYFGVSSSSNILYLAVLQKPSIAISPRKQNIRYLYVDPSS